MDINSRKGFPPPNKSNLYRLLKRFRSILEHNQLAIRPSQPNNETTLLKVCEKLCHRKKLCVRLLKLSGLCVMPEVMQTLHRYRHLRVYSYREYMKADGSIKQNGGVLNISFIPPFVVSDDAEEQVAIDKNSRLRAGLWKEASRFDWDSRSRILQLLFIMAAFSATLNGWIGSSECYSPASAIEIWKRFSDPSFCTAAMLTEEVSSPQDIRQGWETAVKVIKANVAELYHDKEKPIPPRLRRWGRQTEFAVRITDVQERTVLWFGQLVSEMCVMTHDRLAQQSAGLKTFLKPLAAQAEASFVALLEREVGVSLDKFNWKSVFSEEKALELLSRCQYSVKVLRKMPEESSESAMPHSDRDEDENMEDQANSERNGTKNQELKSNERREVLSPISPDVDVSQTRKQNRTESISKQQVGSSLQRETDINYAAQEQSTHDDNIGESETDGSSPSLNRTHQVPNDSGDNQKSVISSEQKEMIVDRDAYIQTIPKDHSFLTGQNDSGNLVKDEEHVAEHSSNRVYSTNHGNYTEAPVGQYRHHERESENTQKRSGRYIGMGRETQSVEKRQASEINVPKKKARLQVNQYNDFREHDRFQTDEFIAQAQANQPSRADPIHALGIAPSIADSAAGSTFHPHDQHRGFEFSSGRRYGKKQILYSRRLNGSSNSIPKMDPGNVSESHRKRIAEKIALQVKREVLLRRQRSDKVEKNGRHLVVPPKKRLKYLKPNQ